MRSHEICKLIPSRHQISKVGLPKESREMKHKGCLGCFDYLDWSPWKRKVQRQQIIEENDCINFPGELLDLCLQLTVKTRAVSVLVFSVSFVKIDCEEVSSSILSGLYEGSCWFAFWSIMGFLC